MNDAPLTGVTILDLSRVLSGPYCTMLAADMGARVIKIEHPKGGDDTRAWGPPFLAGESAYYLSINRNKESVALDFKTPDGRALLGRLLEKADVIVENFRPGTLDKLGLGYSQVAERYPRLIYVSISGFGQTGPRRSEAGYDAIAQAEGRPDGITGVPVQCARRRRRRHRLGMFAFQGLLLALLSGSNESWAGRRRQPVTPWRRFSPTRPAGSSRRVECRCWQPAHDHRAVRHVRNRGWRPRARGGK